MLVQWETLPRKSVQRYKKVTKEVFIGYYNTKCPTEQLHTFHWKYWHGWAFLFLLVHDGLRCLLVFLFYTWGLFYTLTHDWIVLLVEFEEVHDEWEELVMIVLPFEGQCFVGEKSVLNNGFVCQKCANLGFIMIFEWDQ